MRSAFDLARRARLQALLFRHVRNARDIWAARASGRPLPPFAFRNGMTLAHGDGDDPLFLFLEIVANGCYRRRLVTPPRAVIVDIGANIGVFTLDCAARFPGTTIHAYEPNPVAFETLRHNIEANGLVGRVRIYPEAVGKAAGTMTLWTGHGSVIATAHPQAGEPPRLAAECRMVALDTVFERAGGAIDLLKIDAEGAEADILEGGAAIVGGAGQVVLEYHEDRVPGVLERCRSVLAGAGFTVTSRCTRRCGPLVYARRTP